MVGGEIPLLKKVKLPSIEQHRMPLHHICPFLFYFTCKMASGGRSLRISLNFASAKQDNILYTGCRACFGDFTGGLIT